MGTALSAPKRTHFAAKLRATACGAESVDGMDVLAVEARRASCDSCGQGPSFLEARTYRLRAHSMYDPQLYRSKEEVRNGRNAVR